MKNISKLVALAAFLTSLMATSVFADGKVGISLGKGVWAATGEETGLDNTSTSTEVKGAGGAHGLNSGKKDRKGHGAFTDNIQSIFFEWDNGGPLAVGIQLFSDVETPQATNIQSADASGSTQSTNTVEAEFQKEMMLYAIYTVPLPVDLGLYIKAGVSTVDVVTKENMGTGAVYGDTSTDGMHIGFGVERGVGDLLLRVEVIGSEYDDVQQTDSNSASDETAKTVKVTDMIGARATISVTLTVLAVSSDAEFESVC
jgi:hypothetical protein